MKNLIDLSTYLSVPRLPILTSTEQLALPLILCGWDQTNNCCNLRCSWSPRSRKGGFGILCSTAHSSGGRKKNMKTATREISK